MSEPNLSLMCAGLPAREEPMAAERPMFHSLHGDERHDPYYWLNQREDPAVLDYLHAENAYREKVMAPLARLEETLYREIVGRIKEDDRSVPVSDHGYRYWTRVEAGKEYPVYLRQRLGEDGPEEVLLDVNFLAEGFAYYAVGSRVVSPDNRILAFGEDTVSRRIYTLRFRDLVTGDWLSDRIPNTTGHAVWAGDNRTVFYTVRDEALRPCKVYRHQLGTPVTEDVLVFHETDDTFHCHAYRSSSREMILIASEQTVSSEVRWIPADQPDAPFRVFHPRERHHEYEVDHLNGRFVIRTNRDAKNFCLMSVPDIDPEFRLWQPLVPHREDVLIEGTALFHDHLVIQERADGISSIRVRPWEHDDGYRIAFGEDAYVAQIGPNPDPGSGTLRLIYTSMTTPVSTFDYDLDHRTLTLLKEEEVVGDFDKSRYHSERIWISARDGTRIPVSMVYRKGFREQGPGPLLLYGYGAYGISIDPYFSSARLSLLDRGFAFAIAHIRGGEDLGRHWYESGRQRQKANTFTDFIDCGEGLIHAGYTRQGQLFGMGGSAGGLLIGAVVNQRPDLWAGMIAAVPFVDVLTTMLDPDIPLTTGEYDEWGDPHDPEFYSVIKDYSPYDNILDQDYPPLLVTTGLHDSQVQYWEPAKWVARLRIRRTNHAPLLMFCNMETGHGGASGRFARHRETAMEYAFLLDLAGIRE